MARSKKDFSKEAMYKKIMPSILINDDDNYEHVEKPQVNVIDDDEKEIEEKDLSQRLKEDDEANKMLDSNKFIKLDMSEKLFKKTTASGEVINKIEKSMSALNKDEPEIEKQNEEVVKVSENTENHDTNDDKSDIVDIISSIYNKKKNIEKQPEKEKEIISANIMKILLEKKIKFALTKFKVENEEKFTEYFIDDMLGKYPTDKITGTEEFIDIKVKEFEEKCGIDFNQEIVKAIILYRKFCK